MPTFPHLPSRIVPATDVQNVRVPPNAHSDSIPKARALCAAPSRWGRGSAVLPALVAATCLCILGCEDEGAAGRADLVGEWQITEPFEALALFENGTFEHRFTEPAREDYTLRGTWSVSDGLLNTVRRATTQNGAVGAVERVRSFFIDGDRLALGAAVLRGDAGVPPIGVYKSVDDGAERFDEYSLATAFHRIVELHADGTARVERWYDEQALVYRGTWRLAEGRELGEVTIDSERSRDFFYLVPGKGLADVIYHRTDQ